MTEYADPDKVMKIAERQSVRWSTLLDRLADYDGPPPADPDDWARRARLTKAATIALAKSSCWNGAARALPVKAVRHRAERAQAKLQSVGDEISAVIARRPGRS